jgi:hypothetical protein
MVYRRNSPTSADAIEDHDNCAHQELFFRDGDESLLETDDSEKILPRLSKWKFRPFHEWQIVNQFRQISEFYPLNYFFSEGILPVRAKISEL